MWEEILKREKAKYSDSLEIQLVQEELIREECNDAIRGCFKPDFDEKGKSRIIINRGLCSEFKVAILYHELGHFLYFLENMGEVYRCFSGKLDKEEDRLSRARMELKAFRYQLRSLLGIYDNWKKPLKNTVIRIQRRLIMDRRLHYQLAIKEIMRTNLWHKCLENICKT